MMRILGIAFMFLNCSFLCAQTLIIGTLPFNPPFEVANKKNLFWGLDIEIMQNVCALMQMSCEFKSLHFAEIFEQIDSGEIDLGIGSIMIDKIRTQDYLLSEPYFPSSAQFFVNSNSAITSPSQLVGKKIGTVTDPVFIAYLNKTYASSTLKIYDNLDQPLLDLSSNKIDAFFLDKLSVNYWVVNSDNQFRFLGEPISIGKGYAIVAKKNQDLLIQKINQALLDMNKNGLDMKIFKNYL